MTEQDIENKLIYQLKNELGYEYRSDIHDYAGLKNNFRSKFEELNRVRLSDREFERLLDSIISSDVFKASKILRERNSFERDDGTPLNYTLVNINDWCKNHFEVVNQLRINNENSFRRYDVMILMNGIPVVQIELKSIIVSPKKAMEQIVNYKKDKGSGYENTLLAFIQLFIVSNGNDTMYFANNNSEHFQFNTEERFLPIYRFADQNNVKITALAPFAKSFLAKCPLGEFIGRYIVLVQTEEKLIVMRPYQIYAVKAIIKSINENCGNGYIWHTTGSGKTLTSFKASTLLKENMKVDKCLFVVDRKDLDRQTRDEFNKFQEKCVEENTNTLTLVKRLLSEDKADKIIVTTIQKLGVALDDKKTDDKKRPYRELLKPLQNKRIIFIFDECHRSQFGENHKAIKEFFPNSQLFGFTGTPIFEQNATYTKAENGEGRYVTTESVFPNLLHKYTITNAIEDENVLRFHIDYFHGIDVNTSDIKSKTDKKTIAENILDKHGRATAGRKFNAIFAVSSIDDAIEYYKIFKEENAKINERDRLNITCVFSPPARNNPDILQLQEDLEQEKADNKIEPDRKEQALTDIINDYNAKYGTNFSITKFDEYYKDIQERIKNHQYFSERHRREMSADITIVVDMLLTGFDSKYLNTLYADKNLRYHSLIQAFSRTNRVLNSSKPFGNILDFRGQKSRVDEAVACFSGSESDGAGEVWLVRPADKVIDDYEKAVEKVKNFMEGHGLDFNPAEVCNIKGDNAKIEFVNLFKDVQRLKTQLEQYTDLTEDNISRINEIISEDDIKGFKREYLETAKHIRDLQDKNRGTGSEEIQNTELELVLFASSVIDYDYIMELIAQYAGSNAEKRSMDIEELINILSADAKFMDDKEDIIGFVQTLPFNQEMTKEEVYRRFEEYKKNKFNENINNIAERYGVDRDELKDFVEQTLERKIFDGGLLRDIFSGDMNWKERRAKEIAIMKELLPLFHKRAKGEEISGLSAYEE